jgi:hypothetical protein
MKFPWLICLTRLGMGAVAALLIAGCGKAHPPTAAETGAAERSRLKWNLANSVEAYKTAGHTNPAWDEPVKAALTEFARARAQDIVPGEDSDSVISNNCAAAVEAGCHDPLVRYLNLRFSMNGVPTTKAAAAYIQVAQEMEAGSYADIRKFYAWLRAQQEISYAYGYGTNVPQEALNIGAWSKVNTSLFAALGDRTLPPEEAYDACRELLQIWDGDAEDYAKLYNACEAQFPSSWKDHPMILLLKGEANIHFAWDARGGGYADTVSKEGKKVFEKRLETADEALTRAWEMKPSEGRIAYQMMRVELGQGEGQKRMEMWFNRAMQVSSNNYEACSLMLFYVEPKWYGSEEAMLAFGRECVSNPSWGGRVPLILVSVHEELQKALKDDSQRDNYWKRPEVWQDVKAAYDRFFEVNPTETSWYYSYAWYAYQAGQWDEFNSTVPKLGNVNYDYFGGREKFDAMAAEARQHGGEVKTKS